MVRIDCSDLVAAMERRQHFQKKERIILSDFSYEEIDYEKDLLLTENHQSAVDRLFNFLGLDSHPISTDIVRSTDDSLASFIENVDEVYEAIHDSPFSYFLEQESDFKR